MVRNTPEVKQLNTEVIRKQIQMDEKCTKASISKETGLSVATCNTIINEMLETGEIIQMDPEDIYMGRPAVRYSYNKDFQHVLVMFINNEQGINTIEYAVADALGKQIENKVINPEIITYELIVELIADVVQRDNNIQGMTFGIPGVSHHGVIEYCDVDTIVGIDMEGKLREQFGINVEIRNDMDFISTGVYHTIGHNGGNLATMYFPDNEEGCVGCGFVIDGKVLRGYSKFAGEISYIAEAFGIPRKKQMELSPNSEEFIEFVTKMVIVVIGTIDPEVIMIFGSEISDKSMETIRKECEKIVSANHVPRLVTDQQVSGHYLSGLIYVALKQLQFPISN